MYCHSGYSHFFRCCFLVFKFSSCSLSQGCMAPVFHGPQIRGHILIALREFPDVLFLSLVSDGENMRTGALDLEITWILEILETAPPATLATHNWDSSTFRSSSCSSSSSLQQRSGALISAIAVQAAPAVF